MPDKATRRDSCTGLMKRNSSSTPEMSSPSARIRSACDGFWSSSPMPVPIRLTVCFVASDEEQADLVSQLFGGHSVGFFLGGNHCAQKIVAQVSLVSMR